MNPALNPLNWPLSLQLLALAEGAALALGLAFLTFSPWLL
jgi:hypothetical protein